MLVAPAGYGKTTLAEQWVARDGRVAAWYTARPSSTDVAALALGIAKSATPVVGECDSRLRAHLRALPAPAENVETLAEILGEDLAAWPENAWLVLDEYQLIAEEPRAEDFVKTLVAVAPLRVLVASRVRPAWVKRKTILYGEALEVSQAALAMDTREAADVLVERSGPSVSSVVLVANGWPALIGLASVSSAEIEDDVDLVPESLYRYFADEVFNALGPDVRQGLTTLAVAPVLDGELAGALLGQDVAEAVCAAALDVGLLVEREQRLDLHPLARAFLDERTAQLGLVPALDAGATCLDVYRRRREWDAAFELIMRTGATTELDDLMRRGLDELLDTARLSTVQRWCDAAATAGIDTAIVALARAELMLRSGRHMEAVAHAESAAAADAGLAFRALTLAGRAAHLASDEEAALQLYGRAEAIAASEAEVRDAKWGQLICLIELERPDAQEALAVLQEGVSVLDPRDLVRAAAYGLSYQDKLGNLDLEAADFAATLLDRVGDPLIISAFQSTYSTLLGMSCRYDEARAVAGAFIETIDRFRLEFAMPYALSAMSIADAGLRNWDSAIECASEALQIAYRARDGHMQQLCMAQLIRVHVQRGRPLEALDLELPQVRDALPAAEAEVVASRALALAVVGHTQDAVRLIGTVRDLSRATEPAVLIRAVDALCAMKEHRPGAIEEVAELERVAFERGALDLLVTTYRASPEVLSVLLRASTDQERFAHLIRRVRDADLAEFLGFQVQVGGDRRLTLTSREKDVYDLMIQDMNHREIAKLLFIEESTVKAHAHRIYDKLGVRSRKGLIVQALLERTRQATSATGNTESSSDDALL